MLTICAAVATAPVFAQQTQSDKEAAQQNRQAGEGGAARSTLEVQPGPPTIKDKDIEENRKLTPWKRLPRYILQDQKAIWTSPFHTAKSDIKWWAILGGTGAVLIATDRWTSKQLPNSRTQIDIANGSSRVGAAYTLLPISGAFYFIGLGAHDDHFRETGILGFEALADAAIVSNAIKLAAQRERPLEGNGHGNFWSEKASFTNASFPSAHAINSWALASIVAHEYPHPLIVPITAYGLASLVSVSRFAARMHFGSDIIIGAGMGWFIGDYVYGRRHNRDLDKASAMDHVRAHFHLGGPPVPPQLDHPDAERSAVLREQALTAR